MSRAQVIGLDTNVLARYYLAGQDSDAATARQQQAALAGHRKGLDFADALHHATYRRCAGMTSFDDKRFARRATRLGLVPPVSAPR